MVRNLMVAIAMVMTFVVWGGPPPVSGQGDEPELTCEEALKLVYGVDFDDCTPRVTGIGTDETCAGHGSVQVACLQVSAYLAYMGRGAATNACPNTSPPPPGGSWQHCWATSGTGRGEGLLPGHAQTTMSPGLSDTCFWDAADLCQTQVPSSHWPRLDVEGVPETFVLNGITEGWMLGWGVLPPANDRKTDTR